MNCAHPKNNGEQCRFLECPRAGFLDEFDELTNPENANKKPCSYRRKPSWQPKTA